MQSIYDFVERVLLDPQKYVLFFLVARTVLKLLQNISVSRNVGCGKYGQDDFVQRL